MTPPSARPGPRPRGTSDHTLASAWRARVLVLDDEPPLAELLHRTLAVAGFECRTAGSVAQALAAADQLDPELAVVDVMLPDGSGFDLCHQLRVTRPELAVVFLTARDALEDRLTGLNLGGDDYITKPFSVAEVVARVNAVLRRSLRGDGTGPLIVGDLSMDEQAHQVVRAERMLDLSPTEYRLLRFLMQNSGRVMSKQQILTQVWDYDFANSGGVVEKFVSQLRRKIDHSEPAMLHTVRGFYVLRPPR